MQLLYLTHPKEDYLQDQILVGLRRLLGSDCVDYPHKDVLYKNCSRPSSDLYGRGFTVWKTLDDEDIDRTPAFSDLQDGRFDLVIFGSIWRQPNLFNQFEENDLFSAEDTRFAFLDGEDRPSSPPDFVDRGKNVIKRVLPGYAPRSQYKYIFNDIPYSIANPICSPVLKHGTYVKRELEQQYLANYTENLPILPISFSIPSDKIRTAPQEKERLYPSQVQCEEAYSIDEIEQHSTPEHIFEEEQEYYDDLASAKYGITEKKGGWECMRHYEIAANLTVPCFYKLDDKPFLAAPHGLRDMQNCITFRTAEELRAKVQYVEERGYYEDLLQGTQQWVSEHTCEKVAARLLARLGFTVQ